jgi:hypothetical protein
LRFMVWIRTWHLAVGTWSFRTLMNPAKIFAD